MFPDVVPETEDVFTDLWSRKLAFQQAVDENRRIMSLQTETDYYQSNGSCDHTISPDLDIST